MNEFMIAALISGYLLGSIPFGLIFTKLAGLGDIRKVGSKNIGTTNVLRIGGFKLALTTAIFDISKAVIATIIFGELGGFAAVIGHNYPIWLKFKGGKGIATTFGFLLGISPVTFLISGSVWLSVVLISGYSSLGALSMLVIIPFIGFYYGNDYGLVCIALTLLGFWRHHENIVRLLNGTESKVSWHKK